MAASSGHFFCFEIIDDKDCLGLLIKPRLSPLVKRAFIWRFLAPVNRLRRHLSAALNWLYDSRGMFKAAAQVGKSA